MLFIQWHSRISDIDKNNITALDLNLLAAFDTLYQEQSVTRAAERLFLTQSTVSGMLRRLREAFGDALFVRTSHGVLPTPRAEALAPQIREIMDRTRALMAEAPFDPATTAFSIKLSGSDHIQQAVLGLCAGEILARAPHARVSVLPRPKGNVEPLLARGEIDVLVSMGSDAIPHLPSRVLYRDELICITSDPQFAEGQRVTMAAFANLRHVLLSPASMPVRQFLDESLADLGLKRNVVLDVPNFATLFEAMRQNDLTAILPARIAARAPVRFTTLGIPLDLPATEVVANWHPGMTNDARHEWLRETLADSVVRPSRSGHNRPHRP